MDGDIHKAIQGDSAALGALLFEAYDRLKASIAAKIPRQLATEMDADDILQNVFVEAFRHIRQFVPQTEASFEHWLAKIARNQLLDAIKRRRAAKRGGEVRQIIVSAESESSGANLLDLLPGDQSSPSTHARAERMQALRVHLAALPEIYRQAILLRYLQGLSLEEVAAALHKTLDELRGILYRAQKKLRETLGDSSLYLSRD